MTDNLNEVMKAVNEAVDGAIRKLSFDIVSNLYETNPVDTGWSRSNWLASVGKPRTSPVGSKVTVSNSDLQAGQLELLKYTQEKGMVFITNNVPYIIKLNEGSSAQAPAGFVQQAIIRAIKELGG